MRHPAVALMCAAIFALAALTLVRAAMVERKHLAETDPVKISDQALDRSFNRRVAEHEIELALVSGDTDLAQSFVELAADRGVAVDPILAGKVKQANAQAAAVSMTVGRFVQGLWTGEPVDLVSLAGTAFGDLFVFGDVRDAAREGTRYLTGQRADPWILGLAGVGLVITAATYASLGVTAPERIGLSIVKAVRRSGRLNSVLVARAAREAVKVEEGTGLLELADNVGRVEEKAGTQAALDSLQVAEGPDDMSRLAGLAAAKGGKTRAIIKLLGRAAIVLTAGAFDFAIWLFWIACALFGFLASCKATVERVTLRYIRWQKMRRRNAEFAMACNAVAPPTR
jgi:hypothetical protein